MQDVFVPQEAVRDVSIQLIPLLDPATFLEMNVVNMVESLIPSFESLFTQLDNLLAKSAPECRLPVPPDLVSFQLFTDIIFVVDVVCILEMRLERLAPVEYLGTLPDPVGTFFMTSPRFDLVVLGIFMPFRIILTANGLVAGFESASIGASVTLLMLSVTALANHTR